MNISVISEKGNRIEFLLRGTSIAFSNLLRRYAMGQVPVYALDRVVFYENSSALFDEYIAHRIGQIPILSESGKADEVIFTLEAEGPAVVMSKDLKSTDSKIKVALDNIPLLKLLEGQNIRLEAKARMGIGRQHAKFQPGLVSYEILSPNELKFKVESFLQLEPRELLARTAETIEQRCEELESKLSDIKKPTESD
ncbi:MAG: DNA-directed RNA polymerase subunit D [Candidatus Micrarchaeota archaeon]|nr:DNA-directed RNA polymerase subunit D [Candidatus Micrarchaeota archaeon]